MNDPRDYHLYSCIILFGMFLLKYRSKQWGTFNKCIIAATTSHYFFVAARMLVPLRWWTTIIPRICHIYRHTYLLPLRELFHPRNLNFLLLCHSYSYFKILIFVCLTSVVSYIYTCQCYILFSLLPIACFGWRPHQKFSYIVKSEKENESI